MDLLICKCELLLPFRPGTLNWEQLHFVFCDQKSKMGNSNVPHLRSLVSVSCIEVVFQVKILIPSSVRSTKHMMVPSSALYERSNYKLVHLNSRSYNGEIVRLQFALNDDLNNFSGKLKHVPHLRAHNWKIFPKPCACTFSSEQFRWSIQLRKKRCNILQSFGAFFGQSCDRERFLNYLGVSLSLIFLFLDFIVIA